MGRAWHGWVGMDEWTTTRISATRRGTGSEADRRKSIGTSASACKWITKEIEKTDLLWRKVCGHFFGRMLLWLSWHQLTDSRKCCGRCCSMSVEPLDGLTAAESSRPTF